MTNWIRWQASTTVLLAVASWIWAAEKPGSGAPVPAEETAPGAPPAWTRAKGLAPPVKLRNYAVAEYNYGKRKVGFTGVAKIWDPVNGELLWVGGSCGSMEDGFAGNWRTSDGKTWTRTEWTSAVLDPLRALCESVLRPARDGENAARNTWFSGLEPADEAATMKERPSKLLAEATGLADKALAGMKTALKSVSGWEKQSIERALERGTRAAAQLKAARTAFAEGRIDAALLAACFDGQWGFDEAASCLAAAPTELMSPASAYDPQNKVVVLFGGNHGDYVVNDTWTYDCTQRAWKRVWSKAAPAPRSGAKLTWDVETKQWKLAGGSVPIGKFVQQRATTPLKTEREQWVFDPGSGEWIGEGGRASGSRTYATVWKPRDPRWYDSEAKGSREETKKWHDALKPNTWTRVPAPKGKRVMTPQSWGTAPLDPERDLIFFWSGGHCADVTTLMPTYHIAVNRWSVGYVPAHTGKGISFEGRPDCANHTYKHYAYDPVSKKLVMTHAAGTSVYNPDRADFDYNFDHRFKTAIYTTAMVGTPKGVYIWTPGALRLFNEQARKWSGVKVKGKVPAPKCDAYSITFDAKRNALWLMNGNGWKKKGTNVWKLDLASMAIESVKAGNNEIVARQTGPGRESVYVPEADLVVMNQFVRGKQLAFDPEAKSWLLLNIRKPGGKNFVCLGTVGGGGMSYDAKRSLIWVTGMFSRMYVLKVDTGTLRHE